MGATGIAHADDASVQTSTTTTTTVAPTNTGDLDSLISKYTAAHVDSPQTCVGEGAIKTATYTVDGVAVPTLLGHAHQGAKVKVDFKLNEDCGDTVLGLASYEAPSDHWDPAIADQQTLADHASGTFSGNGSHSLEVTLNDCYYQVDFFTGLPLQKLTDTVNYSQPDGRLIAADNGGTKTCEVTPPPTTTPPTTTPPTTEPPVTTPPTTTPPTTAPPVVTESCPTDQAARLVSYSFTINGKPGYTTLEGNAKPGDTVKVDFRIAADCAPQQMSLVSYDTTSDTFSKDTAAQQHVFDSQTGNFGPGDHSMTVNVPNCFFQTDFVQGPVIEHLGPADSTNFYGNRLIDTGTGGKACEVQTTTTTTPTTTTPSTTTPATTTPSTTTPVKVLADEIIATTTTTQPPAVDDQQLAHTGFDTTDMALLAAGLTLLGVALQRAARRVQSN